MAGRIRILLLDDEPRFQEAAVPILPSFDNPLDPDDKRILERNFDLAWCYSIDQAKQLFNYYYHARIHDPAALLRPVAYPNLIWIDYNFDSSHQIAIAFRRHPQLAQKYRDTLDPLRDRQAPPPQGAVTGEALVKTGPTRLPGFFAGINIAMLLRDLACQPVPITAQTDTAETAYQERFLDEQYGRVFQLKSDTVLSWYDFFVRGLPELRKQIVAAVASGTLVPKLSTLDGAIGSDGTDVDAAVVFQSALGEESFRVEALFFEQIFAYDIDQHRLEFRSSADANKAIREWLSDVVEAATGPRAEGELREALRLARRHRFALSSALYGTRLELSAQLAAAQRDGGGEIDRVIESNQGTLEMLGFDRAEIRRHLAEGTASTLKIPADRHRVLGIVDPLKVDTDLTAGQDNHRIVRAAVLALLVYVEFAWLKTQRGDVEALCEQFAELLAADDAMREELIAELGSIDGLPINPDRLPFITQALREGRIDAALAQEIGIVHSISNAMAIATNADIDDDDDPEYLSGVGSNRPLMRLRDEAATKAMLVADLLSPAPEHLLMHRHRKSGGDDVRQILRRLKIDSSPAPLFVNKILRGDLEGGGLLPGDGRLIKVFAAGFGFLPRDWPNWMRDSARF